MAPAGQCGWWLVAASPPSPNHPIHEALLGKGPWSPAWFPGLAFFCHWTRWGSCVTLVKLAMPCYILLTSCCRCPFQQPAAQSPSRPALQGNWTASVAQVQPNFGPTSLPALNALSLHLPVCSQALNVLPPVPINCVVPTAIPFLIEFDF
jgi:hypothetical protein